MMLALGAYPTDPHFDPNRPSWLPFWMDSLTESAMKWGAYPGADTKRTYPDPPRPQAPSVPAGGYTGPVYDPAAVDAVVRGSADAYRADVSATFAGVVDVLDADAAADASIASGRVALLVAAGVAVLILLRR